MIVNISVPTMILSEAVAGGEVHPGLHSSGDTLSFSGEASRISLTLMLVMLVYPLPRSMIGKRAVVNFL